MVKTLKELVASVVLKDHRINYHKTVYDERNASTFGLIPYVELEKILDRKPPIPRNEILKSPNEGLFRASELGFETSAKFFIMNGANNAPGAEPLHLMYGIRMNDKNGLNDALVMAAYEGHTDIVRLLIENGADTFNDALDHASFKGHTEIVKMMLEKGADKLWCPTRHACKYGHSDIIKLLLEHGADDYNTFLSDVAEYIKVRFNTMYYSKRVADSVEYTSYKNDTERMLQIAELLVSRGAHGHSIMLCNKRLFAAYRKYKGYDS